MYLSRFGPNAEDDDFSLFSSSLAPASNPGAMVTTDDRRNMPLVVESDLPFPIDALLFSTCFLLNIGYGWDFSCSRNSSPFGS